MALIVTDIQHYSIEDGPGIRDTIFLKGCNLRCKWCHNPESLDTHISLGIEKNRCTGCGRCFSRCPQKVISSNAEGIVVDREKCDGCGICVGECFSNVFSIAGRRMELQDVFGEVMVDRLYFENSNGGVTISGGEPFLQWKELADLLKMFHDAGVHTIVQTNLTMPFEPEIAASLPFIDLFMVDLKVFDEDLHRKWTGMGNGAILGNLEELDRRGKDFEVHTPVVEGVNDNEEEIRRIVRFLRSFAHLSRYKLLGYHPFGLSKYDKFGIPVGYTNERQFPSRRLDQLQVLADKELGI
ncbi:MAG: glycyl-radical enzyme activating protein [Sphaerochaetaceae bacterium]|nr:glycyl-radical enzyme activating protein [Bacteroidales bacterium]